jgi:hypothetical protein
MKVKGDILFEVHRQDFNIIETSFGSLSNSNYAFCTQERFHLVRDDFLLLRRTPLLVIYIYIYFGWLEFNVLK